MCCAFCSTITTDAYLSGRKQSRRFFNRADTVPSPQIPGVPHELQHGQCCLRYGLRRARKHLQPAVSERKSEHQMTMCVPLQHPNRITHSAPIRKSYEVDHLLDHDWIERIKLIEELSKQSRIVPKVEFHMEAQKCLVYRQLRVTRCDHQSASVQETLSDLATELQELSLYGFVHGDINAKNLVFDGKSWQLVDLEPSLKQLKRGRAMWMITPPYIARTDFESSQITQATDRVGFYFFCRRLLRPLATFSRLAEMRRIRMGGCVFERHSGICSTKLASMTYAELLKTCAREGEALSANMSETPIHPEFRVRG